MTNRYTLSTILFVLATGCGNDDGTITSTVYGEEFIEEGIPASEVSDAWAIEFDAFLVSIGNTKAQAGHDEGEVGLDDFYLVDLAQPSGGEGFELGTFAAPAGTYDHYGYMIRPDANAIAVNVAAGDAAAMAQAGASVWVRGRATRGGITKTFDWAFSLSLSHAHCEAGQTVDGDAVVMQSTIHADHLFYDDAVSSEPEIAFDLIASADGDNDGTISLAELAAVDIRTQARYQVGSLRDPDGAVITNLRQYLEVQVGTLGHINGEGHCEDVTVTR